MAGYLTPKGLTLWPDEDPGPDNQILFLVENIWIRFAKNGGLKAFSQNDIDHFAGAVDRITHLSHDNFIAKYSGMWLFPSLRAKAVAEYQKDVARGEFKDGLFKDRFIHQPSHMAFYKYCVEGQEPRCIEKTWLKGALRLTLSLDMEEKRSEWLVAWVMLRTLSEMGHMSGEVKEWSKHLHDRGGIHKIFEYYFHDKNHPNREDSDGLVF